MTLFAFSVQPFWRRLHMRRKGRKPKNRKIRPPKTRLGLPDLDQSKAAVIGSLRSPESQRGYRHAIQRIHRLVLFGTETLFQSNCHTALPNAPGIPQFGSGHNQRAAGCG
jgi:hypothetical protein